jgi:AcrR family transcriptional regulator
VAATLFDEKSTPDLIREAAMRIFADRGYEATTLQAVADVVGISKQAILHHFRSKEELHDAVLRHVVDHWNRTLPQVFLTAGAAADCFEAVFSETVAFFQRDPDRARLALRELLDRPQATRRLLAEAITPWLHLLAECMRKGQLLGVYGSELDPEAYLLVTFELAVMGVATSEVMGALLGDGLEGRARFTKELSRIAYAASVTPRT